MGAIKCLVPGCEAGFQTLHARLIHEAKSHREHSTRGEPAPMKTCPFCRGKFRGSNYGRHFQACQRRHLPPETSASEGVAQVDGGPTPEGVTVPPPARVNPIAVNQYPYDCPHCELRFPSRNLRGIHMSEVHPIKPLDRGIHSKNGVALSLQVEGPRAGWSSAPRR
jgi:hypothetical protein